MKKMYAGILAGALLCGLCLAQEPTAKPSSDQATPSQEPQTQSQPAQTPQPNPGQAPQLTPSNADSPKAESPKIAPGSVIPVQLTKGIDAKKTKPGEEVDARVTQDLKAGNGNLVIAKDTKVIGHVTEAQARTKEQKESQVAIVFDHAVTKDGEVVSLPMSIQAIISPQALNPGHGNNDAGSGQSATADASASPMNGGARSAGTGGSMTPSHAPSTSATVGDSANTSAGNTSSRSTSAPSITANTQGVVGISDMKLSTAGEAADGSVVSSEKNNVKLENGTLMLLRVNQ